MNDASPELVAPIGITRQIAEGAKGNVRATMADLERWMG